MNNILTFNRENKSIHFSHRHNQLRVVVKDTVEPESKTVIALFTSQETTILKNDENGEIVHTDVSELQHSEGVKTTIFSHKMQYLAFETESNNMTLYFNENEWKEIVDFV